MQRFFALLGHWLHSLAFMAWAGGILAIGALVAPSAFHPDPRFVQQVGPDLARQFAGIVVGESVRKLNTLAFVCAPIMLAATWAEGRVRGEQARRWLSLRGALTAGALALALYLGLRLFPLMLQLQAAHRMPEFDQLHRRYEAITELQFWLLVAGALLTARLAVPRRRTNDYQPAEDEQHSGSGNAQPPERPIARTPNRPTAGAPRP